MGETPQGLQTSAVAEGKVAQAIGGGGGDPGDVDLQARLDSLRRQADLVHPDNIDVVFKFVTKGLGVSHVGVMVQTLSRDCVSYDCSNIGLVLFSNYQTKCH